MLTRMLFINLYVCIIVINLVCLLVKKSNKYLKCMYNRVEWNRNMCAPSKFIYKNMQIGNKRKITT